MARRLEVQIVGDAKDFEQSLSGAEKTTGKFGKAAGVAGLAIAGTLVVALKSSVKAAMDAQVSQAKMENQLKAVGISYKDHATQIEAVIQKTSRLAALDDEDLQDSFSALARTTGDVNEALKATSLAADIARGKNISLEAATALVTKAELGKAGALTKAGIEVDKNATKMELLDTLQKKFAGAAEAYGKTAVGSQERLGVAWENLQEKLGAKLLPVLTKVMVKLVEVITWTEENWPRFQASFESTGEKVKAVFDKLKPIFDDIWKQVKTVVELVAAIIDGDWGKAWDKLGAIVKNAFKLVVDLFKLQLDVWKTALKALGTMALDGLKEGLSGLVGFVGDKLSAGVAAIRGKFDDAYNAAKGFGGKVLSGIKDGLASLGGWIKDKLDGVIALLKRIIDLAKDVSRAVSGIHMPHIPGSGTLGKLWPFAEGGIVTQPTIGLVGEAGPEAIIPLGRGGGLGAGGAIHLHAHIDGTVIGDDYRLVAKKLLDSMVAELVLYQRSGGAISVLPA